MYELRDAVAEHGVDQLLAKWSRHGLAAKGDCYTLLAGLLLQLSNSCRRTVMRGQVRP
jgi:hypothetical protein